MQTLFIAGTDTEIGKTTIACQLINTFNANGLSTLGLKPIASGCEKTPEGWVNADAKALQTVSALSVDYKQVNPFSYEPPIAPHIAAERAKRPITVDALLDWYQGLPSCDLRLIEGCGGWLVPINHKQTLADFVIAAGIPVILVVGMRLGCLNHAMLTVEVLRRQGVTLLGWVANCLDADMPFFEDNMAYLKQAISAPLLACNYSAQENVCLDMTTSANLLNLRPAHLEA